MKKGPHHVHRHKLRITVFDNVSAKTMRQYDKDLLEISDMIRHTTAATKAKLPWIKLASFGDLRAVKTDCLRHNENVTSISGIELDYDKEEIGFADALVMLSKLKCRGLLYTSPSHTMAKPRWRVLFPTSRELEPAMRRGLAKHVDDRCGNIFAPESFTLSQAYYFGTALDNPEPDHCVTWLDGTFIDLCPALEIPKRKKPPVPVAASHDPAIEAMLEQYAGAGVSTDPDDYWAPMSAEDLELEMRVALSRIPADDYAIWYRVCAAIYAALGEAGYALFDEWSQGSSKYDAHRCERKWRDCSSIRSIQVETIFWYADQYDPYWRTLYRQLLNGEVVV